MNLSQCTFPHPVMYPSSEDVQYDFNFAVSVTSSGGDYVLKYSIETNNSTLLHLLSEGKAEAVIHVESPGGFFRKVFKVEETTDINELYINSEFLNGRVEVRSFICAKSVISDYRNEKQHEDYGDMNFYVKEGDYLAVSRVQTFYAYKEDDPLKQLASFIKIAESPEGDDKPAKLVYADQTVKILLPTKLFKMYWDLKDLRGHSATICALIILPALVVLVQEMRTKESEFSEHIWFKGIMKKFEELDIDITETGLSDFELAQLVFDLPIKRVAYELKAQI